MGYQTTALLNLYLFGDCFPIREVVMREKINEEVSVVMYYSSRKKVALPHLISWNGREYPVGKIGYHHKIYEGRVAHHIFELIDKNNTLWFRLNFNTDNLHWILEAVSDGNAS